MEKEAASAGFYKSPWGQHPELQILTIEDLMDGDRIDYPHQADRTYRKAKREDLKVAEQLDHGDGSE